jgi:hypothetical protein
MEKQYRDGMVNTCFLLPSDISAELRKKLIDDDMSIQSLLTAFVYTYLGYDID